MRKNMLAWVQRVGLLGLAGWACQGGCIAGLQRELEVLLSAEANPLLIRQSFLVDLLGPGILSLFT